MAKYRYTIVVDTDSQENADSVMSERIYFDEDYGFDYSISIIPNSEA